MANFQKVFLRIVGRVGDTSSDSDEMPDRVAATGTIFLKPNVKDGWAEQTTGPDNIEELMIPAPISCTIEDGYLTYNGQPFVWLVVGDENWNWNISFPQVRIAGVVRKLDSFNFDLLPATQAQIDDPGYAGINLAELQEFIDPDTGNKSVRGPRGYSVDGVTLVGSDQLAFSLDDQLNTSLPAVTIPAITAANDAQLAAEAARDSAIGARDTAITAKDDAVIAKDAAVIARIAAETAANSFDLDIGTVTTLPAGSAATATVTGTAPTYAINLGIVKGDKGDPGPAVSPDSITSVELATDAVDTAALGSKVVTGAKIADDTITALQIAPDAIGSSELANGAVDTAALGSKVVTDANIADNTITALQIAPDAIGSSELANDAVDTLALQDGSVTSAKIANGTIVNDDINASAAIALSKLADGIMEFQKAGVIQDVIVWAGTEAQYTSLIASQGGSELSGWLYLRGA